MAAYRPLTGHNIMELWLFNTCNFRCGYCGLVTDGSVTHTEELAPYRDPAFIETLLRFFRAQRPAGRPWAVVLTGGEPCLMPNLEAFVLGLGRNGDTVSINTNMSIPLPKLFGQEALGHLAYIQASYHPDWYLGDFQPETFFANVAEVRQLGVPVFVRFVGAPHALEQLPALEARCKALGVTFFPTTLFNPDYPKSYTPEERAKLGSMMVAYASQLQLEGGLVMDNRRCVAADRLYAARLHRGGDITPCISTSGPVLGNIFENTLRPIPGPKPCFRKEQLCSCGSHFQMNIVEGADDSEEFARVLNGAGVKRQADYPAWKAAHALQTSDEVWAGQGVVVQSKEELVRRATKRGRSLPVVSQ